MTGLLNGYNVEKEKIKDQDSNLKSIVHESNDDLRVSSNGKRNGE